ncbi:MAG TPA: D-amino-acid transaminase [Clostridia bacterium]|nr:D-amino-acid transaminase [Clostridia bacterium]
MGELAFVNGNFVPLDQAYVHVEDRGYQFGDGVYEVVYAFNGVPFGLQEHVDRFFSSMKLIRIEPLYTKEEVTRLVHEAVGKSGFAHAQVYFHITRGVSKRSHPFPVPPTPPGFVITVREAAPLPEEKKEHGVAVYLTEDLRWARCNIKSLNLLPNVLAKQAALDHGAFEAVLYKEGYVTEGSVSNAFIVSQGQVRTAPADHRILPGITRQQVIDLCGQLGIAVRETPFTPEELMNADEAFLTGSGIEVLPVVKANDTLINGGKVGPVTRQLQQAFKELIIKQCGKYS